MTDQSINDAHVQNINSARASFAAILDSATQSADQEAIRGAAAMNFILLALTQSGREQFGPDDFVALQEMLAHGATLAARSNGHE